MAENNVITVLYINDVLFGRGSGPNDHEGNIKFRELVSAHKKEYMATNHRQTKAKIARGIVDTVLAKNGRFLKKAELADVQGMGLPNGMDAYVAVSDETVMEKAKQALRQNREKEKKDEPQQPELAYEEYDGGKHPNPEPALSLAQQPPQFNSAYHMPEMVVKPLNDYEEEEQAQLASYTTQSTGQYAVQDPEPAPSPAQQQLLRAAYHNPEMGKPDEEQFTTYTTPLADVEDYTKEQFTTYTTPLADGDDYTKDVRRASLLGGRRDAARRDSAMSTGTARRDSAMSTGSRRESLSTAEVWRRDSMMGNKGTSMDMSDLMNSFKGMSAADFNSSSDTIGTIDHMAAGGLSNMSGMSMGMSMQSVTSLFQADSNDDGIEKEDSSPENTGPRPFRSGSTEMMGSDLSWATGLNDSSARAMNRPAQMKNRESITPGQLANLMTSPIGNGMSSTNFNGDISGYSASSRSALLASTPSLFDISSNTVGESGQVLPPERK